METEATGEASRTSHHGGGVSPGLSQAGLRPVCTPATGSLRLHNHNNAPATPTSQTRTPRRGESSVLPKAGAGAGAQVPRPWHCRARASPHARREQLCSSFGQFNVGKPACDFNLFYVATNPFLEPSDAETQRGKMGQDGADLISLLVKPRYKRFSPLRAASAGRAADARSGRGRGKTRALGRERRERPCEGPGAGVLPQCFWKAMGQRL